MTSPTPYATLQDHHNTQGEIEPSVHGHSGINGDSLAGFPTPLDDKVVLTTRQFPKEFPFNIDTNSGSHLGVGKLAGSVFTFGPHRAVRLDGEHSPRRCAKQLCNVLSRT